MDIQTFLAQAVRLEQDAEAGYSTLVGLTKAKGDHEATVFFEEMVGFSRLHRETAMKRAGFQTMEDVSSYLVELPEGADEVPAPAEIVSPLNIEGAMMIALGAEQRGVEFYESVARNTANAEIRALAEEFAAEERSHVLALERFMGQKPY
jgi:rubrerythrin